MTSSKLYDCGCEEEEEEEGIEKGRLKKFGACIPLKLSQKKEKKKKFGACTPKKLSKKKKKKNTHDSEEGDDAFYCIFFFPPEILSLGKLKNV